MPIIHPLISKTYPFISSFGPQIFLCINAITSGYSVNTSSSKIVNCIENLEERWSGTVVHNALYETVRTSGLIRSTVTIKKFRRALFNEHKLKGIIGRILRSNAYYGRNVTKVIAGGAGTYGTLTPFYFLVSDLSRILSKIPIIGAKFQYQKDLGTTDNH